MAELLKGNIPVNESVLNIWNSGQLSVQMDVYNRKYFNLTAYGTMQQTQDLTKQSFTTVNVKYSFINLGTTGSIHVLFRSESTNSDIVINLVSSEKLMSGVIPLDVSNREITAITFKVTAGEGPLKLYSISVTADVVPTDIEQDTSYADKSILYGLDADKPRLR